jgi:hypothetical protein
MTTNSTNKLVLAIKLLLVMLLTVIAVLTLGYSDAYGSITPALNLQKPDVSDQQDFTQPSIEILSSANDYGLKFDDSFDTGGDVSPACDPDCTVPEPGTVILLGLGLIGLKFARKRH